MSLDATEAAIRAEMQFHPARDAAEARAKAERALMVRDVLRREAARRGFGDDDDAIDALLDSEIDLDEPDVASCRAEHAREPLRSPPLIEAQHILVAAAPGDGAARDEAFAKATRLLAEIVTNPDSFGAYAERHSDCPSRSNAGFLGQLVPGGTVPELDTYLFALDVGEVGAVPVPSRYGFHIIRCLARDPGRALPFDHAHPAIAARLRLYTWQQEVARLVTRLVNSETEPGSSQARSRGSAQAR